MTPNYRKKGTLVKTGFKNILLFLIILIFNNFLALFNAQNLPENKIVNDTIRKSDTVVLKKEQLTDIVQTKAENTRNDVQKRMTYLNKKAQVKFQDMVIDADYISIDWDKSLIFARGELDSLGKIKTPAVATQAGKSYEYDEFTYNLKNRQAIAFNARTEESEGVIVAQKTKKYNDSVFFMRKALYTTDEYFISKKDSIADYYLLAPNIKLVKGKEKSQIITGPIQLYIEQVPTPLIMPFAILPFSDKRSAGILIPSFGEREDVGFFLNSLGYYQPIGEHFDLKILTDIYTKGSWNFRPEMNYRKNYRYNGAFSADIGTTIRGIKGLSDYSKSKTYRIAWRHQQDTKANPFLNFSASVDVVSNKFYNNTVNNNYAFNQNNLNAQQNSSVSIVKRFLTLPITITGTSSYSQNFSTGEGDLKLPVLNVAINQFYLFKPATGIRQGLLENITINTGFNVNNFVKTNEGELFTKAMFEKMQTGLKNNISIRTNTTIAKYFTFSLSANIDNGLTTKTLTRFYNPLSNKTEDVLNKQIAGFSSFSTGASLQTVLYGQTNFKKDSKIQAIRHMMTPQIGFSYSPDFSVPSFGYYKKFSNDRGELTPYSIFDGGIIGTPNSGLQQALSIAINNNLEMKVKSKSDSTGVKKIKIFESLNFTTNYNFAAPTHKWSIFNFSGQTNLFEKLNLNTSLALEPYQIIFAPGSDQGIRTENFGHFSVQGFNAQLSYPLSNETFSGKEKPELAKKYSKKGEIRNENYFFDDDNYARFTQPWTLNINAQYSYSRSLTRFGNQMASVGLDGTLKLTPFWNLTGNLYYDVVTKEIANTRIGFSRDQRSFTINFNWIPYGQYKVYDFFIGIKANILSDALKYEDRSFTQPNAPF